MKSNLECNRQLKQPRHVQGNTGPTCLLQATEGLENTTQRQQMITPKVEYDSPYVCVSGLHPFIEPLKEVDVKFQNALFFTISQVSSL